LEFGFQVKALIDSLSTAIERKYWVKMRIPFVNWGCLGEAARP
jgi:hypothetical protein